MTQEPGCVSQRLTSTRSSAPAAGSLPVARISGIDSPEFPEPIDQLLATLTWLNDSHELAGPPLLHTLLNVEAVSLATATQAQKDQLTQIVARLR